ncbi:hypothetical protein Syun_003854 [Stephania yunnanensis]|uniref:Uncharacterized protein n=1 Tax=Stephania yunnanensis TaxID=152371 RepID=A0AAP0Q077_9MAGN
MADARAPASALTEAGGDARVFNLYEKCYLLRTQSTEILLGRDTRPSGDFLLEAAKQGINSIVGAVANDMGILTTTQLHWMVQMRNKGKMASESDYYEQLSSSFRSVERSFLKSDFINTFSFLVNHHLSDMLKSWRQVPT